MPMSTTLTDLSAALDAIRAQSLWKVERPILGHQSAHIRVKSGDVLISMGDQPIDDLRGLSEALKTFVPAQVIEVKFTRDGKAQTASMKLGER